MSKTAEPKEKKPRATTKKVEEIKEEKTSLLNNYVFMEKTKQVLDTGLKTRKNVVLYGPGGHGGK